MKNIKWKQIGGKQKWFKKERREWKILNENKLAESKNDLKKERREKMRQEENEKY